MKIPSTLNPHPSTFLAIILLTAVTANAIGQEKPPAPEKWEPDIRKFEQADAKEKPEPGQVLFIGSSSIRLWDLDKWFPDVDTINRGFGGSEVSDSVHFFDRIVTPYQPAVIVMYAGDNDIAHGETPEQVHQDFQQFVAKMHEQLPETRLVFVAIKPSIKRWSLIEEVREANALIRAECQQNLKLTFLDIDSPMIGEDGTPKPELFVKDGLHLSDDGYKLWSDLLRPHIKIDLRGKDVRIQKRGIYDEYHPWSPPETLEEWKTVRQEIREQLLVSCGLWPMPGKSPLEPVIHGRIDRDDYTIEKVYFESAPGLYVTGNLYRPKNITGKAPGVLSPHGHWANGRFYDAGEAKAKQEIGSGAEQFMSAARYPLQARMVALARLGCVVFHYDMIGYADSQALPHREGFNDTDASLWLHNKLGLQTWNSIRALDFLESLDDVDPKRIGVTGASGGGTQTFMLCALDDRPAVSFPAVMVSTAMQGGCTCENADYLRIGINNIAMAALFAPKPMAMTGADDWTVDIETKGLPELKQIYSFYGAADMVHAKYFPFPHNYNAVSRTMMLKWFRDHLGLPKDAPVEEKDFKPVLPAELSVYDDEHPRPENELNAAELREKMKARDRAMYEDLMDGSVENFRSVVGTAARVTLPPIDGDCQCEPTLLPIDGGQHSEGSKAVEIKHRDKKVSVICHSGNDDSQGSILWVGMTHHWMMQSSSDLQSQPSRYERPEILFLSDSGEHNAEYAQVDEGFPGYTFGYNQTAMSTSVQELQMVIRGMQSIQKPVSTIVAGGPEAVATLLARAQLPADAVEHTIVDLHGFSFASIDNVNDVNMLPGALKYGDIGGLAALAAPAKITIFGAEGLDEALAPMKKLYAETPDQLTIHPEPLTKETLSELIESANE